MEVSSCSVLNMSCLKLIGHHECDRLASMHACISSVLSKSERPWSIICPRQTFTQRMAATGSKVELASFQKRKDYHQTANLLNN